MTQRPAAGGFAGVGSLAVVLALMAACEPAAPPAQAPVKPPQATPTPAVSPVPAGSVTGEPGAARRGAIAGRVELAPELRSTVRRDAEVIVAAYAVDGPRIPLARRRLDAAHLPHEFTLDDSHAVHPAFTLSRAVQVVVVAHVSAPGASAPAAGDPEGRTVALPAGAHGVLVRIDRRRN